MNKGEEVIETRRSQNRFSRLGPSCSARVKHIDKESGKLPVVARGQENKDSPSQPWVLLALIKGESTPIDVF